MAKAVKGEVEEVAEEPVEEEAEEEVEHWREAISRLI